MTLFHEALTILRKRRRWLVVMILIYALGFPLGIWLGYIGWPPAVLVGELLLQEMEEFLTPIFPPPSSSPGQVNAIALILSILFMILFIFAWNLLMGSLVTMTLAGIVFIAPPALSVLRVFEVGAVYGLNLEILLSRPVPSLICMVVMISLELGSYAIAAVGGIGIGWSLIKGESLSAAFRDALRLYAIVVPMLVAGAVIEVASILLA